MFNHSFSVSIESSKKKKKNLRGSPVVAEAVLGDTTEPAGPPSPLVNLETLVQGRRAGLETTDFHTLSNHLTIKHILHVSILHYQHPITRHDY